MPIVGTIKRLFFCAFLRIFAERNRGVVFNEEDVEIVRDFFCNYDDFRTPVACSKETGLDIEHCRAIKNHLYKERRLGGYYFEKGAPPHKFMRRYILEKFPWITTTTFILEVGPGEHSVFPPSEYSNWYAVDKYYDTGVIYFGNKKWAKNKYPETRILRGRWENLSDVFARRGSFLGKFDLLVSSHSYEHVFKPIQSLVEAGKMLHAGGCVVLFVPDGLSDESAARADPTHTLYIVPEMMKEFFRYAGGFKDIVVESFRPNYDLVITAVKV